MLRVETKMHLARITDISTDAKQQLLLTVSFDKTARLWSLRDGKPTIVLRPPIGIGDEGKLYTGALSPDGSLAAVAGWTGYEWDQSFSVYLFETSSGRMVRRLPKLPEVVHALAFSPDGKMLAAGLGRPGQGREGGVRVWRTEDWSDAWNDKEYSDAIYGLAFSKSGQLVTSSFDGFLRGYDPFGRLRGPKRESASGKRPFRVAISPDDQHVAVGYEDVGRVDVISLASLAVERRLDVAGTDASLGVVAWSTDGSKLFAAGNQPDASGRTFIRTWLNGGAGAHSDTAVARGAIYGLVGVSASDFAFASAEPSWGVFHHDGGVDPLQTSGTVDYGDAAEDFRLAPNGKTVRFNAFQRLSPTSTKASPSQPQPTIFALDDRQVKVGEADSSAAVRPETFASGMKVTAWHDGTHPALNGRQLEALERDERSRAIAVHANRLLLGTEWKLRLFNEAGSEVWSNDAPSPAKAVNITRNGTLAVAAFADGTIRWYDMTIGTELLAVFPHSDRRRWVAWTPQGYYDASVGGDQLLGWHVNQGFEREGLYYPVEEFSQQYNKPEIVAQALESTDPSRFLRTPALIQRPVLTILSPAPEPPPLIHASPVEITYETISPEPLRGLDVSVDGEPAAIAPQHIIGPDVILTVSVPVPRHDASVTLTARSATSTSAPAEVRFKWNGAPDEYADRKNPDWAKPDLYVLAIGVAKYKDARLVLHYSSKDAEDFASLMQAQQGGIYGRVVAKPLTNENANHDNILRELDVLRAQAKPRDLAVLFLSGHGRNDAQGHYYYLPYDFDDSNLYLTAITDSTIRDFLDRIPSKIIVFLDTCFAGTFGFEKGPTQPDVDGLANMLASEERRAVVFASSTGRQFSQERPDWKNGAFTKAIREAFSSDRADYTHSGTISARKLDKYLSDRVSQLTGGDQTPMFKMKEKDDIVFALVRR